MTDLAEPRVGGDIASLFRQRRSVRGYLPQGVPHDMIKAALELAQMAPSNCNTQPWIVHIVSGDKADEMRNALESAAISRSQPQPDFPLTAAYPGEYRTRQIEAAQALFAATGIAREDVAARTANTMRNFRFFDAPHAAFLFLPAWAGWREVADAGIYAHALMLALSASGLASCAQGALSHHADVVRNVLGITGDERLLFGIAFGYEDPEHPVNRTRTSRAPILDNHVLHT